MPDQISPTAAGIPRFRADRTGAVQRTHPPGRSGLPDPISGSAEGRGNDPRATSWPGHAAAGTSNVCDYARRRCQARTTPQAMKDKGHRLRVPSPAGCPAVR